jgi:hypothetical protein
VGWNYLKAESTPPAGILSKIMKNRRFLVPGLVLQAILLFSPPAARAATPTVDYGDNSTATLTQKAWQSLGVNDWASTIAYTTRCIDTYKDQALNQQKALASKHPGDNPDSWALNDVGTCYFIRGKAYEGLKKIPEAIADYKYLVDNLALSACTDPKGFVWYPAKPAKDQMILLAAATQEIDTIEKVDLNYITIKTPSKITTYRITMQTNITFKGQPAHLTDLKEGMSVVVTPAANAQEAASISTDDPPRK